MLYNNQPVTDGITEGVEARRQRGLEIAAKMKVVCRPDGDWTVPSTVGALPGIFNLGKPPPTLSGQSWRVH